jgi:endonuclease-3
MSTNRSAVISKVYKVLKKHYKPISPPADRTVLEHVLYACLLENARYEAADEAFARLKELFFDWNEVRVTTVTELAEGMNGVTDAAAAAQRVKRALQSVFEASYSFDLESLKKQNLGKAEKDLEKIAGTTPFVRAYVTQNALGGHSIPVSRGALDLLFAAGVISASEADKGQAPGLERAIPKSKGVEFASLLQQAGAELFAAPTSSRVKTVLSEIDADAAKRLAARHADLAAAAAAEAAAHKEARDKARAAAQAEARQAAAQAAAKAAGKGASAGKAKEKEAPKAKAPPIAPKKKDEPSPPPAVRAAKGLAKKKPR